MVPHEPSQAEATMLTYPLYIELGVGILTQMQDKDQGSLGYQRWGN